GQSRANRFLLPNIWCRRGDSNSHGLRHCPLKTACLPISPRRLVHFGTSPAFEPSGEGGAGGAGALFASAAGAGAGSAPGAAGISEDFGAIFSITPCCITPEAPVWCEANQVRPRLEAKNTAASIAVVRDRKLADPAAPKRLPDEPLPKAAPMSAPFPCCNRTNPQIATATSRCTTSNNVSAIFMFRS